MTTRYYAETPCEHEMMSAHYLWRYQERANMLSPGDGCPGGSRRELEGVEIVEALYQLGPEGRFVWRAELPDAGRYAIIPLEDPR